MLTELVKQSEVNDFPHYGSGSGDGIVYVGGGKYWPMIVAGIRVMRDTGCKLPVEIWYRGECESVELSDVEELNVRLCDVDALSDILKDSRISKGNPDSGGWEAKLYAIYHTNFDRILFLDADAYCINNPEPLFDLLNHAGFAFWKDFEQQRNSINWTHVTGVDGRDLPLVQGGQLLLDRIKSRKLIHVCNWLCQHSDYYFNFMYGDQDTWRVGLQLGLSDYIILPEMEWVCGRAFRCSHNGIPYVVHRTGGKLLEPKHIPERFKYVYTNPCYSIPREADLFTYFADVLNSKPVKSADVFTTIYQRRLWGSSSKSGSGSVVRDNQPVIDRINSLLRSDNLKSVIDVGCGDGQIGNKYECDSYIGYDCCRSILAECRLKFRGKRFVLIDIYTDYGMMEVADCLICKDVLHHHSNRWITEFVQFLIESKRWKALIFIQDSGQLKDRQDCHTGGYRALSHDMYPMNQFQFDSWVNIGSKQVLFKRLK